MATAELIQETENGSAHLVSYTPSDAAISKMRAEMMPLASDTTAVRTTAGYEKVRIAVGSLRTLRVGIEKRRVELKAESLAWGRKVDSEAKRLTSALLEIEEPLKSLKDAVDAEKEAKRKAAEDAERARVEAEVRAKREEEEARLKAIRGAEEERLRVENERLVAERAKLDAERKAAEEQHRAERERIAAEQAKEAARVKAERDVVEAQQRAEREKIDAERKAVEAEKARLERAEFERQAKAKAEQDAREKVERERIEAERFAKAKADADAAEKARIEALRPDVEKVHAFAGEIKDVLNHCPRVKSKQAAEFITRVRTSLVELIAKCESFEAA